MRHCCRVPCVLRACVRHCAKPTNRISPPRPSPQRPPAGRARSKSMSGLGTSMSIAVQALQAEQGALTVTANNISNVNTPGYSRQVAVFNEAPISHISGLTVGGGVTLEQFQSVRAQLLQLRLYEETQQQGNSQTQLNSLNQIEGLFSDPTQGVGGALSSFFNSLSQLSTDPT